VPRRNGNIALTGEIDLADNNEFMIAVAFGRSYQTTATKLFQSLSEHSSSTRSVMSGNGNARW